MSIVTWTKDAVNDYINRPKEERLLSGVLGSFKELKESEGTYDKILNRLAHDLGNLAFVKDAEVFELERFVEQEKDYGDILAVSASFKISKHRKSILRLLMGLVGEKYKLIEQLKSSQFDAFTVSTRLDGLRSLFQSFIENPSSVLVCNVCKGKGEFSDDDDDYSPAQIFYCNTCEGIGYIEKVSDE